MILTTIQNKEKSIGYEKKTGTNHKIERNCINIVSKVDDNNEVNTSICGKPLAIVGKVCTYYTQ